MKIDTSVVGCIFSLDRKKILLIKRRDVPVWVLPGGGIDENESPEKAILRELNEETGFEVKIVRKVGEYTPINRLTRLTHLFECSIISGNAQINSECKDIKFFDIDKLPPLPPPYNDWIDDSLLNTALIKKSLKQVTYFKLFKNAILHPLLVLRFLLSRLGVRIND